MEEVRAAAEAAMQDQSKKESGFVTLAEQTLAEQTLFEQTSTKQQHESGFVTLAEQAARAKELKRQEDLAQSTTTTISGKAPGTTIVTSSSRGGKPGLKSLVQNDPTTRQSLNSSNVLISLPTLADLSPNLLAKRRQLLIDLTNASDHGLDPTLEKTVPLGIAFHHGDLLSNDRALIERGFRDQAILAICCTTTLAAGVNLPCRRVLVRSLSSGIEALTVSRFRQICGRAGRAGFDTRGECVVWAYAVSG